MTIVGLQPWLPWPLSRWSWLTRTVPAERLAALRIGLAAVMLLDVLGTYLPGRADLFGPESVAGPDRRALAPWHGFTWSLIDDSSPEMVLAALVVWAVASFGLLIGFWPRWCAVVCWACS